MKYLCFKITLLVILNCPFYNHTTINKTKLFITKTPQTRGMVMNRTEQVRAGSPACQQIRMGFDKENMQK